MRRLYRSVTLRRNLQAWQFARSIINGIRLRDNPPNGLSTRLPLHNYVQHLHLALTSKGGHLDRMTESLAYLIVLFEKLQSFTITLYKWDSYLLYEMVGKEIGKVLPPAVERLTIVVSGLVLTSVRFIYLSLKDMEEDNILPQTTNTTSMMVLAPPFNGERWQMWFTMFANV